ncbi:AT-rich interaction domain 6 [Epinephelus lanceolatus]|uniref:AT-rich interaction domain 6 n=1 Tax=Epinephelus lanceolatus TaxID=310571 RepID=UPI0014452C5E|nr:AT-rich interaction domain 6 [Epinephelus lanceolatus]
METQARMEMARREIREERTKEPVEELTEEQFLKDLYLFMKKRDTPIERIPNLGFKQIDLFLMFKVVRDLGGYHQVTAQQLWKQVYNTLGGNPRSTSAATCTRRHYEKLLLPYECHLTGVLVNVLPRNPPKHFHFSNYSKEHVDGQRPAKRKMISIPLHQNHHNLQSDPRENVFPLQLHYPHYYHPSHAVLPPHVPMSSSVLTPHSPPASKPWFTIPPSHLNPTDRVKEPLEQLRFLAEQYKTTSGLTEPLNLSIKASRQETNSNPTSSFTPTSSGKNPKFLNKPSPLYTPHRSQVMTDDGCETQGGDSGLGDAGYPARAKEVYIVDGKAPTASSSPTYDSAQTLRTEKGATTMALKPSSPKTDFTIRPEDEREGSPEVRELSVSHILPSLPRENGGKMEIEVPLSVFHNWLRLCGSSALMHEAKQLSALPPQEEHPGQRNRSDTDVLPTNLTFHINHHDQSSAAEDLRLMQRNLPSPIPTSQFTGYQHNTCQNNISTYKPLPSGGILKSAASWDVYPVDQQDNNNSYSPRAPSCWDAYDKESQTSLIQVNINSSPCSVQQDFDNEDTIQAEKEKSGTGQSAVLMLNPSSNSLLHFTTEEVMKLKKIISSS